MRRLAVAIAAGCVAATLFAVPVPASGSPVVAATAPSAAPPMGWNSWNRFGCNINEQVIRGAADGLIASGMRDAGYEYVNIDDCWAESERNAEGKFEPNHTTFPSGIKALADYVHERGLKLGIYTSAGTRTCALTMPGGLDHEDVDAQTFADWGVDYLKYDNCNNQGRPAIERYTKMGEALKKTGREIVYALCEWGENQPWKWGKTSGAQLWRTTGDISDSWSSMTGILDQQVGLEAYSGPGGWNDPDMLEVGNGGMTDAEYRSHFALWSLMNAPLLAGNDLSAMSEATKKILLNKDLIAVDQDWGGKQGHKVRDDGDAEVWAKPMSDGSATVVLLNRGSSATTLSSSAREIGLGASPDYRVRDLWTGSETESTGTLRAGVPSHGSAVFRVWPAERTDAAPHTSLALQSDEYVTGDGPFTATVTLFNDGSTPVKTVSAHLGVAAGWKVQGSPDVTVPEIAPGKSWKQAWTIRPDSPDAVNVALTSTASYETAWGTKSLDATGSTAFVFTPPKGTSRLSKATWVFAENGWGPVERGTSNGENGQGDGHRPTVAGTVYLDALGVHSPSKIRFYLGAGCRTFTALTGLDDEAGAVGSAQFTVVGDGKQLATTGVFRPGTPAKPLQVSLTGVRVLDLVVTDGGDGNTWDHSDWINPMLTC
jgi:alpha-galactosidase